MHADFLNEWFKRKSTIKEEILYHYTTAEGVYGILENNEFLATKSNFLNDKLEFLYTLEVLEKLLDRYIVNTPLRKRFYAIVREEIDKIAIVSSREQIANEQMKEQEMDFYVVSFSKQANSALIWAEFTDFKGYSMGFDGTRLIEGFADRVFIHGTVIYDLEEQIQYLLEELLSIINQFKLKGHQDLKHFFEDRSHISENSLKEIGKDMALICSIYGMFFKKHYFAGEEEYRFIFAPLQEENEGKPQFRMKEQVFLPYIMAKFEKEMPLVSVMVGAKNNSDIAVRGMAFYLKGKGMEVPVIFSDIPLRY